VSEAGTPTQKSTSVLRPSAAAAAAAWRALVLSEREQVERLPNRPRPEDFYGPVAESFKADPRRTTDPLLDILRAMVRPDETWLDVGAGGGRYTLPIALLARRVFAVEPSAGMRGVMVEACREFGIDNVDLFDERWPCASATPIADVGFISQVGYDIPDFGAFLDQLEARSRRLCVAVLFARAPISDFAPLWPLVYSEERVLLPGLAEFTTLLFAKGRLPETRLLTTPPRTFPDLPSLHAAARRPL
jgi:SAM-dependent methyltransferase